MPQFLTSDGCRIHWREAGSGPTLLLVHGLGSSGADWAFQVPALADRHRLVMPDLRGSGRSDRPPGRYRIEAMAADLWQLLDAEADGRACVAGFSLGGAVALEMALQRPDAVDRLVLINSLPSYRVDHWRKWLELNLQVGMVRMLGLPRVARMVAGRLFPHPHQAPMRARVADVVGRQPVEPYLATARALADWCAADRIGTLRPPTLLIAGEHDYTPLDEKRRWASRMGAAIAVVRGSRHGTPFDSVTAANALLRAFLSGEALPPAGSLNVDSAETAPTAPPEGVDIE